MRIIKDYRETSLIYERQHPTIQTIKLIMSLLTVKRDKIHDLSSPSDYNVQRVCKNAHICQILS